ncbi:Transcription factor MADS-box [Penicillium coprophilum]|uniref:Transcription factor MADS-box n=1 Tax=Penicillium coprophilum TaxID=36646 RepID=UPI00239B0589|nr:Transcription factor MADS-box [Penicillium coprophilum]KAJ5154543.1 Transcription factor MADS-box [Penicillium coprophilum]
MGRRKIEIKAIKDDRNRSVTFLKRKGGLFKKAHELAVLCSVDVAVIIFGHNKKLYEYSSCDMHDALGRYQYFGPPHEHKGPEDFAGKRDDDDEEDEVSPAPEDIQAVQQNHPAIPPHLQNQPAFQHMNHAPSASPPIHAMTRHGTPQPQGTSRPSSRNHIRRVSSNLGPSQHGTPPPPPPGPPNGGFTYMQNPSMYNPNVHAMNQQPRPGQFAHYGHPPGQHQGTPPMHQHGLPPQQMPPQHQAQHQAQHPGQQHFQQHGHVVGMPPGPHQHVQAYMQEHGRNSMPPGFAPDGHQERTASEHPQDDSSGAMKVEHSQSPPQMKSLSKSRSIFTPIDDRGSVLARFGPGAGSYESHNNHPLKLEALPQASSGSKSMPVRAATEAPRGGPIASTPKIKPPSRTNSGPLPSKRPQLKVQIPSETSDGGSATADSSRDSAGNRTSTPARGSAENGPPGVVLPPPSPSAGAIVSAGAQGPPNPFARPPPPVSATRNDSYGSNNGNQNNGNNSNNIETPISALPSRFVSDALLPSPSSFFPEWGFGRSGPDSNMLPSPLTFPTPAVQSGPSFSREDEQDKKRKSPDGGSAGEGTHKKPKT